jgi:hypothetical protein
MPALDWKPAFRGLFTDAHIRINSYDRVSNRSHGYQVTNNLNKNGSSFLKGLNRYQRCK